MESSDERKPEYDFAAMTGGERGKYADRLRAGGNIVVLEDDIATAFPTDAAVNEALRAVLRAASVVHRDAGAAEPAAATDGASRRG